MSDTDSQSHNPTQHDAQARWSRFRDAVKGTLPPEQWTALEAAWCATLKPTDNPTTQAEYVVQPPGSLARILNSDGTVIFAYRTVEKWRWCDAAGDLRGPAAPWGVEGRTCRITARDVAQVSPTRIAAELRPITGSGATSGLKIGDRVRVVRVMCTDSNIITLEEGTVGKIIEHDATGTLAEQRQCWRVWTDENRRDVSGWHADDELELVS